MCRIELRLKWLQLTEAWFTLVAAGNPRKANMVQSCKLWRWLNLRWGKRPKACARPIFGGSKGETASWPRTWCRFCRPGKRRSREARQEIQAPHKWQSVQRKQLCNCLTKHRLAKKYKDVLGTWIVVPSVICSAWNIWADLSCNDSVTLVELGWVKGHKSLGALFEGVL